MNKLVQKIIKQTQLNYNILASHFSYSRGTIWLELRTFTQDVNPNSKVLDVGCGHGRLYELLKNKNADYLGIDFSEKLIKEGQKRYPKAKFRVGDITQEKAWEDLSNQFDFIFCIATLHHLPIKELQQQLVKNIKKALKPNGRIYITVWNLWQSKYLKHHFSVPSLKLKWQLKNLKVLYFPYKLSQGGGESKIINRFVYAFCLEELKELFKGVDLTIGKAWSSDRNLCLVATKKV